MQMFYTVAFILFAFYALLVYGLKLVNATKLL